MMIPEEQIEFHPMSQMDMNGRLFRWNDGLFRAILPTATPLYQNLFERKLVDQLIDHKLMIETQRTELNIGGYGMVVQHRRLPFVSYPYEWSAGMFKAAALKVLDLQIELQRNGLSLHDAHPWNILFEGTEPFYIDFTSIVEANSRDDWSMYATYCDMFLNPLLLMSEGYGHIARRLMFDMERGVAPSDVAPFTWQGHGKHGIKRIARAAARRVMPEGIRHVVVKHLRSAKATATKRMIGQNLPSLRDRIEAIPTEEPFDLRADFLHHPAAVPSHPSHWERAIDDMLRRYRPATILDVGPDGRQLATLLMRGGGQVVSLSAQPGWCDELYRRAHAGGLDGGGRILPLVMSLRAPTPGYGIGHHMAMPAERRLRCEAVVAIDLLHKLSLGYLLSFDKIADTLAAFGERYALVEFVPPADPAACPTWYTPEHLHKAMRAHYTQVSILKGTDERRPMVLGVGKRAGKEGEHVAA